MLKEDIENLNSESRQVVQTCANIFSTSRHIQPQNKRQVALFLQVEYFHSTIHTNENIDLVRVIFEETVHASFDFLEDDRSTAYELSSIFITVSLNLYCCTDCWQVVGKLLKRISIRSRHFTMDAYAGSVGFSGHDHLKFGGLGRQKKLRDNSKNN